jgi:hypothetical protein
MILFQVKATIDDNIVDFFGNFFHSMDEFLKILILSFIKIDFLHELADFIDKNLKAMKKIM